MTEARLPDWEEAVVYHVFLDRFRRGHDSPPVAERLPFRGVAAHHTRDARLLTGARTHERHFLGGDLRGVLEGLDHIQSLGANVLLLSPLYRSRSSHRYDADDHADLDPGLGTFEDYHALRRELARRGMRLMLDGVFAHTSWENPWWTGFEGDRPFYRYRTPGRVETWMGWDVMPRLDTDDPAVQEALLATLDVWGPVDGWRLDAAQHLSEGFIRRLGEKARSLAPGAVIIGEEWEWAPEALRSGRYDGILNFPGRRAVLDFLSGETSAEAFARRARLLTELYPRPSWPRCLNLLGNHDTDRVWGKHARTMADLEAALACLVALPGTPLIYQGDELGLRADSPAESRGQFPWEPRRWKRPILERYRHWLGLRHAHPSLRRGELKWLEASNADRFVAFARTSPEESALIGINLGPRGQELVFEGRKHRFEPGESRAVFHGSRSGGEPEG